MIIPCRLPMGTGLWSSKPLSIASSLACGSETIAIHPRSYDRDDMVFDPLHYLPLIEQKIMSFDQAAPLQGWELPEVFSTLQRLLEARQGKKGKREYVQILRLLERFELDVPCIWPSKTPSNMGQSASTLSSIWSCVGWSGGHLNWTWIFIPICQPPMSAPHQPHPI